jgi:hypothetical protein
MFEIIKNPELRQMLQRSPSVSAIPAELYAEFIAQINDLSEKGALYVMELLKEEQKMLFQQKENALHSMNDIKNNFERKVRRKIEEKEQGKAVSNIENLINS